MAVEFPGQIVSLPCISTGIGQYKFVDISTAGNVIRPTANGQTIGVSQTGTTGSTVDPKSITVMISGISKLAGSTASTCGVGEVVAATTLGGIKPMTAAAIPAGRIIAGSSGAANRVLSVLIASVSASTATV